MKYSDCCGAAAGEFEDVGICPRCKEHCEWQEEGEGEEDELEGVKYAVIRISGVAVGVGFSMAMPGGGTYSEKICDTLFDTGNDQKDAAESEKWANIICNALNKTPTP